MKINIRQIVKDYEGKEMLTKNEEGKNATVNVRRALNFVINGTEVDANGRPKLLTAEEKGKIYQLSTKLWNARKVVDFTSSEVTFIRVKAGKISNITPLLYGRVCDLLEGKSEEKDENSPKGEASPKASPKKG